MDRIGLETLHQEMLSDSRVVLNAFRKAEQRFARREEIAYESCGHQLSQMYNAIEQTSLRASPKPSRITLTTNRAGIAAF